MKVFYLKSKVINEPRLTWEQTIEASENDPNFEPETIEVKTSLESVVIPDHLVDKFRENFGEKNYLQEDEIFKFLEENK